MILVYQDLIARGGELILPFRPDHVQPSSIDLRLGNTFRVFRRRTLESIDLAAVPAQDLISSPVELPWYRKPDGSVGDPDSRMIIHPGEMVLGATLERITVPSDLAMQLAGKSSLARLGLLPHVEAGWFDPGWDGIGTLEIANLGSAPIVLRPGLKIVQSKWFKLDSTPDLLYGAAELGSRYQGGERAEGSRYEG